VDEDETVGESKGEFPTEVAVEEACAVESIVTVRFVDGLDLKEVEAMISRGVVKGSAVFFYTRLRSSIGGELMRRTQLGRRENIRRKRRERERTRGNR
jgi:hypothetical protein